MACVKPRKVPGSKREKWIHAVLLKKVGERHSMGTTRT